MARTGERKKKGSLRLKVELLNGSKIVDSTEVEDIETEDEGGEMIDAIEAALTEFGYEFDDEDD